MKYKSDISLIQFTFLSCIIYFIIQDALSFFYNLGLIAHIRAY